MFDEILNNILISGVGSTKVLRRPTWRSVELHMSKNFGFQLLADAALQDCSIGIFFQLTFQ